MAIQRKNNDSSEGVSNDSNAPSPYGPYDQRWADNVLRLWKLEAADANAMVTLHEAAQCESIKQANKVAFALEALPLAASLVGIGRTARKARMIVQDPEGIKRFKETFGNIIVDWADSIDAARKRKEAQKQREYRSQYMNSFRNKGPRSVSDVLSKVDPTQDINQQNRALKRPETESHHGS